MLNISILIVEDEPLSRQLLVESVKFYVEHVYEACDGEEAYKSYLDKRPDIILSDINMPKENGLDFIAKVRKHDTETKIIILSAYTNIEYFQKAVPLYLLSYLIKPISLTLLEEEIYKAVKKIESNKSISLSDNYTWQSAKKKLYLDTQQEITLTHYEALLIDCLVKAKGEIVYNEMIHYAIYDIEEFSQSAITSLVKRLRKKTSKNIISSCYGKGYKI